MRESSNTRAGWNCFLVTVVSAVLLHMYSPVKLTWICDNLLQLATASIVFSFALSVYLYVSSFHADALLAVGGNSGACTIRTRLSRCVCVCPVLRTQTARDCCAPTRR